MNPDTYMNPNTQDCPIKQYFVYLLQSDSGATYVGATIDLDHRLRQHNKEIKGGARATSAKVVRGEQWRRVCHVRGFPDWTAALQFEWRWKQLSRKYPKRMNPLERRLNALGDLLSMEKPTTKSVYYREWTNEKKGPDVVQEIESPFFSYLFSRQSMILP
jgi:predicted GIY-YIG superfamily endonuclease